MSGDGGWGARFGFWQWWQDDRVFHYSLSIALGGTHYIGATPRKVQLVVVGPAVVSVACVRVVGELTVVRNATRELSSLQAARNNKEIRRQDVGLNADPVLEDKFGRRDRTVYIWIRSIEGVRNIGQRIDPVTASNE